MHLLWVELRDFRNHADTRLEVPEGLVTVVGPNGEGKTNLLEGMYFLTHLDSPRVSADLPLIRQGAESAFVRGEAQTGEGKLLIEVEIRAQGANRVQVNRSPVRRKRDLRRLAPSVFFGPDDLDMVQGDPGARRRFMDQAVAAVWPAKETALRTYEKTLRQRNRLLKDHAGPGEPPGLAAWDEELIASGTVVTATRRSAIERVAPPASAEFETLSGYGLGIEYLPSVGGDDLAAAFRERLTARRGDELARRTTLVGPHRDDLGLTVRDLVARGFASHGEAWGAALSLRLGLATAIEDEIGERPVILLDDPFSALDPVRRGRIGSALNGRGQVVVSVADGGHIPPASEAIWDVATGAVSAR
ncbi:MAG: DNA replication/repair protein RecF [Actinomycetota bacterium]